MYIYIYLYIHKYSYIQTYKYVRIYFNNTEGPWLPTGVSSLICVVLHDHFTLAICLIRMCICSSVTDLVHMCDMSHSHALSFIRVCVRVCVYICMCVSVYICACVCVYVCMLCESTSRCVVVDLLCIT